MKLQICCFIMIYNGQSKFLFEILGIMNTIFGSDPNSEIPDLRHFAYFQHLQDLFYFNGWYSNETGLDITLKPHDTCMLIFTGYEI